MSITHPYLFATLGIPATAGMIDAANLTPNLPASVTSNEAETPLPPVELITPSPLLPPISLTTAVEDLFMLTTEEEESEDGIEPASKTGTAYATYPQQDKFALIKRKHLQEQQKIKLADAEELHTAKVRASWWACIPFLSALVGIPFIPTLFYAVRSPQEQAAKREDERRGYRSLAEASEQEQAIKSAQVKATLLPCGLVTLGILGRGQLPFQRELTEPFRKMISINTLENLETWLPKVLEALSWGALAIPVATMIWDKPAINDNATQQNN
ncbi:MAG: hypothetical protein H2174_03955 [Vampirovibrio sp.]|nr:hypothetical protein [Vampirovibrio sp.]